MRMSSLCKARVSLRSLSRTASSGTSWSLGSSLLLPDFRFASAITRTTSRGTWEVQRISLSRFERQVPWGLSTNAFTGTHVSTSRRNPFCALDSRAARSLITSSSRGVTMLLRDWKLIYNLLAASVGFDTFVSGVSALPNRWANGWNQIAREFCPYQPEVVASFFRRSNNIQMLDPRHHVALFRFRAVQLDLEAQVVD